MTWKSIHESVKNMGGGLINYISHKKYTRKSIQISFLAADEKFI